MRVKRTGYITTTTTNIAAAYIFLLPSTLNRFNLFTNSSYISMYCINSGFSSNSGFSQTLFLFFFLFFCLFYSLCFCNALLVVINRRGTESLSNRLTSTGGACSYSTTGFTTTNRRRKFRFTWFFYNKKEVLD